MDHSSNPPGTSACRVHDEGFTANLTATLAVTLRSTTYGDRAQVSRLLAEALEDSGCWVQHRAGSASGLILIFEAPLRELPELYPSLLESSLQFDRRGRCELEMLCTLGRYALEREGLSRVVLLRLEVAFADELHPSQHVMLATHA